MRIVTNRVNSVPVASNEVDPAPVIAQGPGLMATPEPQPEALPLKSSGQKEQRELSELEVAVEKMNKAVKVFNHALEFEVTKSNRIIIRVLDTNTGEVIRQIPPEELMESFKRMEDALGVLIDRRV